MQRDFGQIARKAVVLFEQNDESPDEGKRGDTKLFLWQNKKETPEGVSLYKR